MNFYRLMGLFVRAVYATLSNSQCGQRVSKAPRGLLERECPRPSLYVCDAYDHSCIHIETVSMVTLGLLVCISVLVWNIDHLSIDV